MWRMQDAIGKRMDKKKERIPESRRRRVQEKARWRSTSSLLGRALWELAVWRHALFPGGRWRTCRGLHRRFASDKGKTTRADDVADRTDAWLNGCPVRACAHALVRTPRRILETLQSPRTKPIESAQVKSHLEWNVNGSGEIIRRVKDLC